MLCLVTVMKRLPGARHQNIAVVFWCYEKANEAAKWPTTVRVTPVLQMLAIFVVSALGVFF